ncbi:MAG: DUF2799 domain-containing protein [Pseudomonadota bacterium]
MDTFSARRRLYVIHAAALIALVGCASGPGGSSGARIDCQPDSWSSAGERDALAGAPESRRDAVAAACPSADMAAYGQGYNTGLRTFCLPASAYTFGLDGGQYAFNCPGDLEPGFVYAYGIGYEEFELNEAVREADRNLNRTDRRVRDVRNEVSRQEQLFNSSTNRSSAEMGRVRTEVSRLQRRLVSLQQERATNRILLDQAQAALKKYRENRPAIPGVE